jgi:hypothetical protein
MVLTAKQPDVKERLKHDIYAFCGLLVQVFSFLPASTF